MGLPEPISTMAVVPTGLAWPRVCLLVAWRPVFADLPAAIAARRPVAMGPAQNVRGPFRVVLPVVHALKSCAIA